MMTEDHEHSAQAYVDLAIAYLEMNLVQDALRTVRSGLEQYPTEERLLQLLKDVRLRVHER